MSRNPRSIATWVGFALTAGLVVPGAVLAQDSSAIAQMKPNAGKAPVIPILEFTNTDVRSVFRLLSEYSAVDIVVDPAVSGSVNTVVTNKNWQEVVHIVAKMLNLTVTNELGYLYVQKTDDYQKRLLEKAAANSAQDQAAKLQRKIIRISNAKADEMEKAVKDQLSPRGKITVVSRTNSLIVVDGLDQINAIEKVIRQLDMETNQILIEAKLVQVESNALQELGIDWSINSGSGMGMGTAQSPSIGQSATNLSNVNQTKTAGSLGQGPFRGANISNHTPTQSVPGQTVAFGLLNGNLGVAISHLLETGKAEVLATPQITTLDNKEARIFMGDVVPIQTKDVSGNTITAYVNAGTELTVLPQITATDRVLLNLRPKKDNYAVVAGAGVVIKKQEAETNVVVTDGETVVIGGLVERDEIENESGVPLLKDIPLLGVLFRYTRHEIVKKDLAIFVTPRIVRRGLVPMPVAEVEDLNKAATAPSVAPAVVAPAPVVPAPAPVVAPPPPPAPANPTHHQEAIAPPPPPPTVAPIAPEPPPPSSTPAPSNSYGNEPPEAPADPASAPR